MWHEKVSRVFYEIFSWWHLVSCDANQTKNFCNEKKTFQDVILLEFCKAVRHIERQHSKGYEVNSKEKSVTSNEYIFIKIQTMKSNYSNTNSRIVSLRNANLLTLDWTEQISCPQTNSFRRKWFSTTIEDDLTYLRISR